MGHFNVLLTHDLPCSKILRRNIVAGLKLQIDVLSGLYYLYLFKYKQIFEYTGGISAKIYFTASILNPNEESK